MSHQDAGSDGEIEIGPWRAQPTLNRLRRGETTVRVEPKLMDVLLLLVRHAGTVVSKEAIAAAVWPGVFISDSVITRAIAGLRKALGDDAREPRFIETIAKRGYRLLAGAVSAPESAATAAVPGLGASSAAARPETSDRGGYVFGQWVRGARFYGRSVEVDEILHGARNGLWLLGPRAIGKTSLLKHLEHLTAEDPAGTYFPLFWDLQGSIEPEDLHGDFRSALMDVEERLEAFGVPLREVAADDFLDSLALLRRALRARGRTLLLLWDEVEELIHLHARSPVLLRKLRRALQSQEGVRTVIASGPRLWQLAEQRDDTSPFLHGFAPPLYLGPLDAAAAADLVHQRQAPAGSPRLSDPGMVGEVLERSGRHPALLQLLAARTLELGDVDRATDAVAADPTVQFFLAVDFDLLEPVEREILLALARGGGTTPETAGHGAVVDPHDLFPDLAPLELRARLGHLEGLGLLRRKGERAAVAHPILDRWLLAQKV